MPMQLGAAESDTPAEAFQQYEEETMVKAVEQLITDVAVYTRKCEEQCL